MSKYLKKYPESGYVVTAEIGDNLTVRCPMHGLFEISKTNFLHFRGCQLCRGVHPRAYPVGSPRDWTGYVVAINADGSVSRRLNNPQYAIGYSDKRVAEAMYLLIGDLGWIPGQIKPFELEFAARVMLLATTFRVLPVHRKRVQTLRGNCVSLHVLAPGFYEVKGPDNRISDSAFIDFYRNRLSAELVAHIVGALGDYPMIIRESDVTAAVEVMRALSYIPTRHTR